MAKKAFTPTCQKMLSNGLSDDYGEFACGDAAVVYSPKRKQWLCDFHRPIGQDNG